MVGSDKHSKGIRMIAQIFRDHGIEVIYLGEHNTSQQLVAAAVSEDADFIGVSFSNGNYVRRVRELTEELAAAAGDDIGLVVGGLIHADDVPALEAAGVAAVFGPESQPSEILATIDRVFAGGRAERLGAGASATEKNGESS